MESCEIRIECPNPKITQLMFDYVDQCEDDFKLYCKNIGIKINYFDADNENNLIIIE